MRRVIAPVILFLVALATISTLNSKSLAQSNGHGPALQPPMTTKKTKTTKIHGDTMVDDYFWLREKKNPEVIAHLEAENAYTDAV